MTEAEWKTRGVSDRMLRRVRPAASPRKSRLFGVACGYRVWQLLPDPRSRTAIQVAERFADGEATAEDLRAARGAPPAGGPYPTYHEQHLGYLFHYLTADDPSESLANWLIGVRVGLQAESAYRVQLHTVGGLVRCIFGNPFRPAAFAPDGRTDTVLALATGVYADRGWDRLPVLADALEDAGCDNAEVIDHLRTPGPHARGCWVVDGLLGKS